MRIELQTHAAIPETPADMVTLLRKIPSGTCRRLRRSHYGGGLREPTAFVQTRFD